MMEYQTIIESPEFKHCISNPPSEMLKKKIDAVLAVQPHTYGESIFQTEHDYFWRLLHAYYEFFEAAYNEKCMELQSPQSSLDYMRMSVDTLIDYRFLIRYIEVNVPINLNREMMNYL
jgi:hypothetical protein